MRELQQLRTIYALKTIERANSVGRRKESPAEHTWSCLVLADYFLTLMKNQTLDRLKVYELLLYHDLVEIETGDVNILDSEKRKEKNEQERKAAHVLRKKLPPEIGEKFFPLFMEYLEGNTPEARLCQAIDALDAELHELDYKEDWKGWTEAFLRKSKEHLFKEFPELREAFEQSVALAKKQGYFEK